MSDQQPEIIEYKSNNKHINIGMIICFIFILYFVVYFLGFILNRNDDLFEVTSASTESSFDSQYTALAIRSETVVTTPAAGYVSFYVGDKTPVYVGESTYLIDKNGELSSKLKTAATTQAILNENDYDEIAESLNEFKQSYSDSDFYTTYQFRYQIDSQILESINSNVFANNTVYYSGSYSAYNSELAGIAVHYTDGFESCTLDNFDASCFRKNDYIKNIIRSNDYVAAGDAVYKVITSEDWYLVIQVSDPNIFQDFDEVTIKFLKDDVTIDADFELTTRNGNYYGIITLDKYMVRYASDRYIQISFEDDTESGLMIPKTSVTSKSYYVIPREYKTKSGTNSTGFLVKSVMSDGTESAQFCNVDILKETDTFCYISMDNGVIGSGDVLLREDSDYEFEIGMTDSIQGVYSYDTNTRVTSFRFVDITGENGNYYIISDNTNNGLIMYDQVYVDYKDAEEDGN